MLLSLFSGLTVALRIISPFIVKLGLWLHTQFVKKCQQQKSQQDRVNTISSNSLIRTSTQQDEIAQVATESIR
ncbi:unnamed protein product, partial [Rotaria sordida]